MGPVWNVDANSRHKINVVGSVAGKKHMQLQKNHKEGLSYLGSRKY